jgi:hypothetical protein
MFPRRSRGTINDATVRKRKKRAAFARKEGRARICIKRICKRRLCGRSHAQNPNEPRARAREGVANFFPLFNSPAGHSRDRRGTAPLAPHFAITLINAATRPTPRPVADGAALPIPANGIKRKEVATLKSFLSRGSI